MTQPKLIESPDKFLAILEKSGLLKPQYMEAVKSSELASSDPLTIARALLKKQLLTKWQAQQLLSGFFNLAFGKYTLCDQLGKGELGNVYLAENPKLGRKVALKTLSKRYVTEPTLVEQFLDKARAAAALDHPNIIHVHDVASEGERHFVVMEHVDGQDLQAKVDADGVLEFTQARDFVRQAAEALQYAHGEGVKHLDLKPANLMVDGQGVVKILDFGVGHLRRPAPSPDANTGELMISATSYMAPEQARGAEAGEPADIYSLGGTLYFLLTGRAPFAAANDDERAKLQETKQTIPIRDLRSDAPPALCAVCDKAMALKAEDRYASMAELLEAMSNCQNGAEAVAELEVAELEPAETETAAVESTEPEAEVAEPEAEVAEPEAEVAQSKGEKIEIAVKPKQPVGAISIDTGDDAKPALGGIGAISINTKRRKKRKPDAKPETTPEAEPNEPAAEAQEPAPTAAKAKPATKTKDEAAEAKPATEAKPAAKAKPAATKPAPTDETPEAEPLATSEPEEAEAEAELVELKKGPSLVLIIGGLSAAAVLLLVIGLVAGMFLFGGGSSPAVAQAPVTDEPSTDEAPEEGETQDDAASAGSDAAATDGGEDAATAEANTEATEAGAESDGSATTGSDTAPAAPDDSAKAEATTTEVAAPAIAPNSESGNADVATPAPASNDDASPPAASPTESKPAEEPAETKKQATEEPEEKKKKAPEKKTAPPKKKPQVFTFPQAKDLPAPTAEQPEMVLGKVNVSEDAYVLISLSGGETAFNSRTEFSLQYAQYAQDGAALRDWEFHVTEGSGDPIVIATLSLREKELKFKWAEIAATNVAATNLGNCSLKVTAGEAEPAEVALRIPQPIPGVAIDLDKTSGSARWPIEGAPLPDRSSLRMEVMVNGHKATVEPAQLNLQKSDYAYVYFAENRDSAALLLKVTGSATTKNVQVKIEPQFLLPGEKPQRLTKATLRQLPQLQQKQAQAQAQFLAFEKEANKAQNKQLAQNQLAAGRQALEALNQAVSRLQQLETEMAAVNGTGSLQFRVFAETIDKPIDLLLPDPDAEPIAP